MTTRLGKVVLVLGAVLAACATKKEEPPRPPRTYCEQLLRSRQEHSSAIRLPPAEYHFCENQVAGEAFSAINRDGAAPPDRPARGASDPAPFSTWSVRAPETIDWDDRCCSVEIDWYLRFEYGRVIASESDLAGNASLPFKVDPVRKRGEMELDGQRHVLAVDGGYLVGFDAGEFGGGVWWFAADGKQRRKLTLRASDALADYVPENVHALARLGNDVLAFEGLTHGGSNSGRVVRLARGSNGAWRPSLFTQLRACPHAVLEESPATWLLATTSGVWRLDAQARERPVWQPPGGHLYYPNSLVRDASGVVYMGMRNMVVRFTPQQEGLYAVQVLVPPRRGQGGGG